MSTNPIPVCCEHGPYYHDTHVRGGLCWKCHDSFHAEIERTAKWRLIKQMRLRTRALDYRHLFRGVWEEA